MAWLVGYGNADRVRAICTVDATPPARAKAPQNDPIDRVAFYVAAPDKSLSGGPLKATLDRLEAAKFPVSKHSLGEKSRELNSEELTSLARWIDSLDRI